VVRVLAQEDHFQSIERGCVKGIENELAGGVNGLACIFLCFKKMDDLQKIRFGKFGIQHFFPQGFNLNIHTAILISNKCIIIFSTNPYSLALILSRELFTAKRIGYEIQKSGKNRTKAVCHRSGLHGHELRLRAAG
jgi:hypothetical protein